MDRDEAREKTAVAGCRYRAAGPSGARSEGGGGRAIFGDGWAILERYAGVMQALPKEAKYRLISPHTGLHTGWGREYFLRGLRVAASQGEVSVIAVRPRQRWADDGGPVGPPGEGTGPTGWALVKVGQGMQARGARRWPTAATGGGGKGFHVNRFLRNG